MKIKGKIIGLTLISIILFTGTVFAATNGLFEGFPIVNVVVNGKVAKGDVPGINFNGRTMVPLRLVGEALGADISWDQKTFTAYVNSKNTTNGGYSQEHIDRLKLYSEIANHYIWLEDLGETLNDTSSNLSNAFNGMYLYDSIDTLKTVAGYYDQKIKWYNDRIEPTKKLIIKAKEQGIDISDMNSILNYYSDAIDYYNLAFKSLLDLSISKSDSDYDKYAANSDSGYSKTRNGLDIIRPRYHEFLDKIHNF